MALLVVMVLMSFMLTTGFALVSTVDTQTRASKVERVRDSAFNLAESALNAQVFVLARDWPGLGAAPVAGASKLPYGTCTQSTGGDRCPDTPSLLGGGSADLIGATWQTTVRDNSAVATGPNGPVSAPGYYADATIQSSPGYDANGDGQLWVRARATTQGRTRTLVALVRSEKQEEDLPHAALIAGSLDLTNNGNKELIKASGGLVALRCPPPNAGDPSCLGQPYGTGKLKTYADLLSFLSTQITGVTPVADPSLGPAMTAEARDRLMRTAMSNGTYYETCPSAAQITAKGPGQVVYIKSAGDCRFTSNTQFNTPQNPGALIVENGSVTFAGTSNYYGVVYAANVLDPNGRGFAVHTQGNAKITGGVLIDGMSMMDVGSSSMNIQFDLNAYRAVASYGSAGVVQNTWREIRTG